MTAAIKTLWWLCLIIAFRLVEPSSANRYHRVLMARSWISFACSNRKTLISLESIPNHNNHQHPLEGIIESFRSRLAMPSGLRLEDHIEVLMGRLERVFGRVEAEHKVAFIKRDTLVKELKGTSRTALMAALHEHDPKRRVPLPLSPTELLLLGQVPVGRGLLIPLLSRAACNLETLLLHADLLGVKQYEPIHAAMTALWRDHVARSIRFDAEPAKAISSSSGSSVILAVPRAVHLATAPDTPQRTKMIDAWVTQHVLSSSEKIDSPAKSVYLGKIDGSIIDTYAALLAEASVIQHVQVIPSTVFEEYTKYGCSPMVVWRYLERVNQIIHPSAR